MAGPTGLQRIISVTGGDRWSLAFKAGSGGLRLSQG